MSDNPFDDLGDDGETATESGLEGDRNGADTGRPASEPAGSVPANADPEPQTEPEPEPPSESGPAFEYDDVRQKPLYARGETWDQLEDELGITVTPELRRMGIRDDETREVHDAILKVALDHIDEVADQIYETRKRAE
ncbi:hypothetical protein [Natrialba sp. INN-245]|uniref:hypothetical protein n=1 Tax=Natrialba sp. INN-245 TaxID=2690967 RepID=UPI0013104722|nr:hypothetical protein [Natrialba sp. INN-245]MWV39086.1 hypothetical protein [Natrialba sp. INN-245]